MKNFSNDTFHDGLCTINSLFTNNEPYTPAIYNDEISQFNDLIEGKNVETVYSKAMIGLHANNPQRPAMFNNSRPFLNTLFVIKELI